MGIPLDNSGETGGVVFFFISGALEHADNPMVNSIVMSVLYIIYDIFNSLCKCCRRLTVLIVGALRANRVARAPDIVVV